MNLDRKETGHFMCEIGRSPEQEEILLRKFLSARRERGGQRGGEEKV